MQQSTIDTSKVPYQQKLPFFLSPYLLFTPILVLFFVIIFFSKKSWAQNVILGSFIATCLYFFFISAAYTLRAYILKKGTFLFRIAGLLSTLNTLVFTVGLYVIAIAPNFSTFLAGLACLLYSFISPYLYAYVLKIKREDSKRFFSSIGLTTDTWLALSGKLLVKQEN